MSNATERGQGLTEFALVFPLFVLLLVVVFDFGRAVYAYHTISNAALAGARVAIVNQAPDRVRGAALAQTVGLDPNNVLIDLSALTTSCPMLKIGCETEVTVSYAYRTLMPIVGDLIGAMTLSATTRFPIERVYATLPAP